jgi:hypothetical protein
MGEGRQGRRHHGGLTRGKRLGAPADFAQAIGTGKTGMLCCPAGFGVLRGDRVFRRKRHVLRMHEIRHSGRAIALGGAGIGRQKA